MMTHGLSPNRSAADSFAPLPDHVPAMRIDLRTRGILQVSPALASLAGRSADALVGRPHTDLWPDSERAALARRIDDVLLFGHDHFGCVMLAAPDNAPIWVEVDAEYGWTGSPHVHVAFRAPAGQQTAAREPSGPPVPDQPVATLASTTLASNTVPEPAELAVAIDPARAPMLPLAEPPATSAEASAHMMTALEAVAAAALAVGADGTVASATPEAERMLGTPIARLRGAPIDELLSFPDQAGLALAAARRSGLRQCVAAVTSDGRAVALEWLPAGEPEAGLMVLLADRPTSEDAERLRLQTRLVSFIAHDVRNSLAAVYCGLHNLADQFDPLAEEFATLDKALADTRRASRIVDDVLAVSRPGQLNPVTMDLAAVLTECVDRFRSRAAAHGVIITERYDAAARVHADLSQLERAFDNLIENALQAMPHGGQLTVASRFEDRAGRGVLVSIADTGVGIQADMRPNVFEPYATRKKDGTGLGLAITRRAILDHEGQINFTTADGRGTTFWIWLPCS